MKNNIKAKFNANAVLFKNDLTRTNNQITQNLENTNYNFGDVHKATNFYENLVVEWKANKKWSFHVKASHTYLSTNHKKTLNHNDSTYNLFKTGLYSEVNNTDNQYSFVQPISSTASSFISEGMAQYRSKLGEFRFGTRYHYREMASLRDQLSFLKMTFQKLKIVKIWLRLMFLFVYDFLKTNYYFFQNYERFIL
jgi:hypothetical protein